MKRRAFIAGMGLTAPTLVAGCLNTSREDSPEEKETSGEESETTDGTESDESDGSRRDSIFVENLTDDEIIVEVHVERKADSERLVDNSYEIPKATGLEIPDIGEVGAEYAITTAHNGETETFDWRVLTCTNDADDSGATDLGIEISDDGVWIGNNDCDETGSGDRRELSYEHHEDYLKEA